MVGRSSESAKDKEEEGNGDVHGYGDGQQDLCPLPVRSGVGSKKENDAAAREGKKQNRAVATQSQTLGRNPMPQPDLAQ